MKYCQNKVDVYEFPSVSCDLFKSYRLVDGYNVFSGHLVCLHTSSNVSIQQCIKSRHMSPYLIKCLYPPCE